MILLVVMKGVDWAGVSATEKAVSTAVAATEEVCTNVNELADHRPGEYGCWFGVVEFEHWEPGFNLYFSNLYDQRIVATSDREWQGSIQRGDCVHLWGTLGTEADSDTLNIKVNINKPIEVFTRWTSC